MIATITPMMIIIFVFFHQYFRATRVDVFWKESAWKETIFRGKKNLSSQEEQTSTDMYGTHTMLLSQPHKSVRLQPLA